MTRLRRAIFRKRPCPSFLVRYLLITAVTVNAIAWTGRVSAGEALVAVASNFKEPLDRLETAFETGTDHRLIVVPGSTGKLYAQIVNGAPFDMLLAADRERPRLLEESGRAVAGSRFTYAVGRLVLWSADPHTVGADGAAILRQGAFRRLAIANPDLAPYGKAALQVLDALSLTERLRPKLVMGENIGQAFTLAATGNADLGFVALSQVQGLDRAKAGSSWEPSRTLYEPIRQDAVLLARASGNEAAHAFLDYLKSEAARTLIERSGYGAAP